ncbi:MAG: hypothetical protein IPP94_18235 [Ignavibacteria bacterium]|nr:hypothetical protein [Ignavibacteria bacterium]
MIGDQNIFLVQMAPECRRRLWATYFGAAETEAGYYWVASEVGLAVDVADNIYVSGFTKATDHIAYGRSWQQSHGGGGEDAFLAKFGSMSWGIATLPVGQAYCAGDTLSVDFIIAGSYADANEFIVQLSNENGFFDAPVEVGRIGGYTATPIPVVLPVNAPFGTAYRLRVVSTIPRVTGSPTPPFTIYPRPVAVIVPPGPIALCRGHAITLSADSSAEWTYAWEKDGFGPVGTAPQLPVSDSGSYRVIVTSPAGCRVWSPPVQVSIVDPPAVGIIPMFPKPFCDGDSVILHATPGLKSYLWSTGDTTADLIVRRGGRYRVIATNAAGCADTSELVEVTAHPLPAVSLTGALTACQFEKRTYRAAIPPQCTATWTIVGGELQLQVGDSAVVRWTQDGDGSVTVSVMLDSSNCTTTAMLTVKVRHFPQLLIERDANILCLGTPLGLRVAKGYASVQWNTGAKTEDIVITRGGLYRVKATMNNGCWAEDSVLIPESIPPLALAGADTTVCGSATVNLRAQAQGGRPPYTYSWTGANVSNPSGRTSTAKPSATGVYVVEVTDSVGCTGRDSLRVTVLPAPPLAVRALGPTSICEGDSVFLEADTGFVSYRWSDGRMGRSIAVKDSGTYAVEGRDALGCVARSQDIMVTVTSLDVSIRASGPTRFCEGDSVLLETRDPFASYRWSGGETTRSIVARRSGLYLVRVRDSLGCEGESLPVRVTVDPPPTIGITGPTTVCTQSTATYRVRDSIPGAYAWSVSNGSILSGDGTATLRVRWDAAGSARISVTVTPAQAGCAGTASMEVTIGTELAPVIIGPTRICEGDTALLDAGDGYVSYEWKDGADAILGTARTLRLANAAQCTLTVRDDGGCSGTATHVLMVNPKPQPVILASGPLRFCAGDSVTLRSGAPYATYAWRDAGGVVIDSASAIVAKRSGVYTLTVTDANGCSGISPPVTVTALPSPMPHIDGPPVACAEGAAVYRVTPPVSAQFAWQVSNGSITNGDGTDRIAVLWNNASSGRVIVTVTQDECSASDTLDVRLLPPPSPSISGRAVFCAGDSTTLDAGAGYASYDWRDGSGTALGATRFLRIGRSGEVNVTVTDSSGCSKTSPVFTATANPLPMPVIIGPDAICPGDTALLDAGPGYARYEWRSASGASLSSARFLRVASAGSYHVIVTDGNNCTGASPEHPVALFPDPVIPRITRSGDTLTSTPAASYSWMRDNAPTGSTTRSIIVAIDGRYTVRITDANGCRAESDPIDFVKSVSILTTVALPVLQAAPGERVIVPVRLAAQSNIAALSRTDFTAELRFNRSLLFPSGNTPTGSIQGQERVIPFVGSYADNQTPLSEMTFTALLGDSDRTALRLTNFVWADTNARVVTADGEFLLTVCREGGARLFIEGAHFGVTAHPNPFNAATVVEYTLVESGPAQLLVLDALGREVATLLDGPRDAGSGRVTFDASALASGVYRVVLRSPTMSAGATIFLVK